MDQHQRDAQASGGKGKTVHLINGFLDEHHKPRGVDLGDNFIADVMRGHAPAIGEELWCVNGWWHYAPRCTLGFEMHDFGGPSYEAQGEQQPWYMYDVIGKAKIPIFMPRADPRFQHVIEYPLQEVLDYFALKEPYFGESPNYMIAMATM